MTGIGKVIGTELILQHRSRWIYYTGLPWLIFFAVIGGKVVPQFEYPFILLRENYFFRMGLLAALILEAFSAIRDDYYRSSDVIKTMPVALWRIHKRRPLLFSA